jgi:hypothetical protein
VRGGDGDDHRRLADLDAAGPVVDRDVAEVVAPAQLFGDLRHDLLGHAGIRLVLEVRDGVSARMDSRRPDERGDRAGLVRLYLVDDAL